MKSQKPWLQVEDMGSQGVELRCEWWEVDFEVGNGGLALARLLG